MPKDLILTVKGIDTIIKCIKPYNNTTYTDGIIKGFDYLGVSQTSIVVQNICNKRFIIPAQTLFTQNDNLGSTFEAYIEDTIINENETINLPVYYNGVYNGNNNNPIYNFVLNGINIVYQLIVSVPDTLGTIVDFSIDLGNRQNYTFTPADFINHHTDVDNDTITAVFLFGNVGTIRLNGQPYIANTRVPLVQVQGGALTHIAPDTNAYIESSPDYKIEDSVGNIIT